MSSSLQRVFLQPVTIPVRVTRLGFLPRNSTGPLNSLEGHVTKMTALRTRFNNSSIVCSSPDGTRNMNGFPCVECLHSRCRLQLRIYLRDGALVHLLHLNIPSANNILDLESDARHDGEEFCRWRLKLTVLDHGTWPEVRFHRIQ